MNNKRDFFFKQLEFKKHMEGVMVASFTDNRGDAAEVITSHKLVPGLRYQCKLGKKPDKDGFMMVYTLLSCRLWKDNLGILTSDENVELTLDKMVVEDFTFGRGHTVDVDGACEKLRQAFVEKRFQIPGWDAIDSFIDNYRTKCELVYGNEVRRQKKIVGGTQLKHKTKTIRLAGS
jgi:hypothetical protein